MPDDRDPSEELKRLDLHLALPHTRFSRAVDGFLERLGQAEAQLERNLHAEPQAQ